MLSAAKSAVVFRSNLPFRERQRGVRQRGTEAPFSGNKTVPKTLMAESITSISVDRYRINEVKTLFIRQRVTGVDILTAHDDATAQLVPSRKSTYCNRLLAAATAL